MRDIPTSLQDHLNTRATNLAYCVKLTRKDSTVLSFTDHDQDLVVDSVTYSASTGLYSTERQSNSSMSVDNLDISGYLESANITSEDVSKGLYDNATIEIFLVNWKDTTEFYLVQKGNIGNITKNNLDFIAEVRGITDDLQKTRGNRYERTCSAILGDIRCKIDTTSASYSSTGSVATTDGVYSFTTTSLSSFDDGFFGNGFITFTSGPNNLATREIKSDITTSGVRQITLWEPLSETLSSSDTFSIVAGCNKSFETCRTKFNNIQNFRGFPHMPPKDEVFKVAVSSDKDIYDGQSLFS